MHTETKKRFDLRNEDGFTLMELMVVIGVLAILIAILLPQFTGYTDKANAVSAAAEAKTALTALNSYYITSSSRGVAFNADAAKNKINEATKNKGTADVKSETEATYTVTKGGLTFTAKMNAQEGIFADNTGVGANIECTGNTERCKALQDEGDLSLNGQ